MSDYREWKHELVYIARRDRFKRLVGVDVVKRKDLEPHHETLPLSARKVQQEPVDLDYGLVERFCAAFGINAMFVENALRGVVRMRDEA